MVMDVGDGRCRSADGRMSGTHLSREHALLVCVDQLEDLRARRVASSRRDPAAWVGSSSLSAAAENRCHHFEPLSAVPPPLAAVAELSARNDSVLSAAISWAYRPAIQGKSREVKGRGGFSRRRSEFKWQHKGSAQLNYRTEYGRHEGELVSVIGRVALKHVERAL